MVSKNNERYGIPFMKRSIRGMGRAVKMAQHIEGKTYKIRPRRCAQGQRKEDAPYRDERVKKYGIPFSEENRWKSWKRPKRRLRAFRQLGVSPFGQDDTPIPEREAGGLLVAKS